MNFRFLAAIGLAACSITAFGLPYSYAKWTTEDFNSVSGTVGGVGVTFTGPYVGVLTNGVANYYTYTPSDYISSVVSNAPVPTDNFIQLVGGNTDVYSVTFDTPVHNLVVSVLSLGAPGDTVPFEFDRPFTLLSQGTDQWGGSSTALTASGNTLLGEEGSGSVLFAGDTKSLTWTLPKGENWYGFTVATPVPSPAAFAMFGVAAVSLIRRRKRA